MFPLVEPSAKVYFMAAAEVVAGLELLMWQGLFPRGANHDEQDHGFYPLQPIVSPPHLGLFLLHWKAGNLSYLPRKILKNRFVFLWYRHSLLASESSPHFVRDAGCWILDARCSMLDARCCSIPVLVLSVLCVRLI
jgi:hypothetical protein